jgi:hypothetical protein
MAIYEVGVMKPPQLLEGYIVVASRRSSQAILHSAARANPLSAS